MEKVNKPARQTEGGRNTTCRKDNEKVNQEEDRSHSEKTKHTNVKKFKTNNIRQEDLINDNINDKQERVVVQTPFHSSWAKEVEEELSGIAIEDTVLGNKRMDSSCNHDSDRMERQGVRCEQTPWETLRKNMTKPKIRKPVILKNWFGEKPGENSDSSLSSQGEDEGWTEIERKRMRKKKTDERNMKIKEKKRELSTRMIHMVGIGPIPKEAIQFHENRVKNSEEARKAAVCEFLQHYLDYDNERFEIWTL